MSIYRYKAASVTVERHNVQYIENPIKSKTSMNQFNRNSRKYDCLFDYLNNSISEIVNGFPTSLSNRIMLSSSIE